MLNVLDEFTNECLAIRVARKLKAIDVMAAPLQHGQAARIARIHAATWTTQWGPISHPARSVRCSDG